ncbi:polysaccharide biosynthesis/export family protein [Larkinella soli]|uniref:polysaccharide biosynthesis/export family protein n=1 Tax=Larkinella soli TaxID=1770527 RepID=UPI0013E331B5|nr:polysaccharide biosynthesis/export family protein [Larkinella soli]
MKTWIRNMMAGFVMVSELLFFSSCKTAKDPHYFDDLNSAYESRLPIENQTETRILPGDQLNITVVSSNTETNNLFNTGTAEGGASPAYLVDKDGSIRFPVIGKIKVSNLTPAEASAKLTGFIGDNYVKNPIVNVTISNFKITLLGKVRSPQTLGVEDGKINILEAIARAGDIAEGGDKKRVLIIREKEGIRSTVRLDLTNREVLNSPYFYLQQNDVVYVQPEPFAEKTNLRNSLRNVLTVVSLISTGTLLFIRLRG